MNRVIITILLLMFSISTSFIVGCNKGQYYFQVFTYPSNIPAYESGWLYRGEFRVFTNKSGSMFRQGNKTAYINIYDVNDKIILSNKYDFMNTASVKAEVSWPHPEKLDIKIYEYGSKDVDDEYSRSLAKKGKKLLKEVSYNVHK